MPRRRRTPAPCTTSSACSTPSRAGLGHPFAQGMREDSSDVDNASTRVDCSGLEVGGLVTITVTYEIDISCGDMLAAVRDRPQVATSSPLTWSGFSTTTRCLGAPT